MMDALEPLKPKAAQPVLLRNQDGFSMRLIQLPSIGTILSQAFVCSTEYLMAKEKLIRLREENAYWGAI